MELSLVSADRAVAKKSLSEVDDLKQEEKQRLSSGLARHLRDRDINVRISAAEALGRVGSPAKDTILDLLGALHYETDYEYCYFNNELRRTVVLAIDRIGPPAQPALLEALKNRSPWLRYGAAIGLSMVNPPLASRRGVKAVVRGLKSKEVIVQRGAVITLGEMGAAARRGVGPLIQCHRQAVQKMKNGATQRELERFGYLRIEILEAIGRIGPGAKVAIPTVIEELKTPCAHDEGENHLEFHMVAAKTLERLAPASIPYLVKELKNGDLDTCRRVAPILGHIGPDAEAAVPVLRDILLSSRFFVEFSKDQGIGDEFLMILRQISPKEAATVMDSLASEDSSNPEQQFLVSILADDFQVQSDSEEEVLFHLIRALDHENVVVRRKAARGLASLGSSGQPVLKALTKALKDKDHGVQLEAARALGKMGPAAEEVVPDLIHLLYSLHGGVRQEAARALGHIGTPARSAIPYLIEATEDRNPGVRKAVSDALVALGWDPYKDFRQPVRQLH